MVHFSMSRGVRSRFYSKLKTKVRVVYRPQIFVNDTMGDYDTSQ